MRIENVGEIDQRLAFASSYRLHICRNFFEARNSNFQKKFLFEILKFFIIIYIFLYINFSQCMVFILFFKFKQKIMRLEIGSS